MPRLLLILVILSSYLIAGPMEALENYNVILIHGAAYESSGFDCSDVNGQTAWEVDYEMKYKIRPWQLGKSAELIGSANEYR